MEQGGTQPAPLSERPRAARFTSGSTLRHVISMTATGSIGLIAIFVVDALNLFYISMLGVQELAAAIGFAGTLLFFTISVSIGFTIAASALVSRALGRGDRVEAAKLGGASMVFVGAATAALALAIWPFLDTLVGWMGARGETARICADFLRIVIPSSPVMALGMCTTGILRGVGDARRAMYVTLSGGVAAAILDPLLIFGLDRDHRRRDLDRPVALRDPRGRPARRACRPSPDPDAGPFAPQGRDEAVLRHRHPGAAHPDRDAGR